MDATDSEQTAEDNIPIAPIATNNILADSSLDDSSTSTTKAGPNQSLNMDTANEQSSADTDREQSSADTTFEQHNSQEAVAVVDDEPTEKNENQDNPVLHVMVVGFHHQKGSQVEFCHPPLPTVAGSIVLPDQWKPLPFLALPDGSHNFEKDSVFFHMNSAHEHCKQTVFGVACYRQVDSKDYKKTDDEVTRSTVQKSVCVLLNQPLFGFVVSKVEAVTNAFFNEMDFSKTDVLKEFYDNLHHSFVSSHFTESVFNIGLPVRDIFTLHKEKILVLLKTMLLERKVVVYASSASDASLVVLSLTSLFPGMLHKGLAYSTIAVDSTEGREEDQSHVGSSSPTDQFGFPLRLFEGGCALHPYLSLQEMDTLKTPLAKAFVVGVANMLYLRYNHCPADFIFNVVDDDVLIRDSDLSQAVSLTTEDLRFVDFIVSTINQWNEGEHHSHWEGSEDWVRFHVKAYLLCLASTASSLEPDANANSFNGRFVDLWKQTRNYKKWLDAERPGLADFPHGHPFAGEMAVSDVRLRLQQIADTIVAYSGPSQRIGKAVRKTGEIVGTVYSSAKWTLSSLKTWVSGVVEEIDHEMESSNPESGSKDLAAEDLATGMTISAEDRLGGDSAS